VKDRLDAPASALSGGQQQRLCIARAIAVKPQVLLMDEPCSALDPISTLAIEDLITELKDDYTIVIVTHNMQQAARVSDRTGFFNTDGAGEPGRLVELDATAQIFSAPSNSATEAYISGRFGQISESLQELVASSPCRTQRISRSSAVSQVSSVGLMIVMYSSESR